MKLDDLKSMSLSVTRSIAHAMKDEKTAKYIHNCIRRFFSGDFGNITEDDKQANLSDLEYGEGHISASYDKSANLESRIYIEAHFYNEVSIDEADYNNIIVMYPFER